MENKDVITSVYGFNLLRWVSLYYFGLISFFFFFNFVWVFYAGSLFSHSYFRFWFSFKVLIIVLLLIVSVYDEAKCVSQHRGRSIRGPENSIFNN